MSFYSEGFVSIVRRGYVISFYCSKGFPSIVRDVLL